MLKFPGFVLVLIGILGPKVSNVVSKRKDKGSFNWVTKQDKVIKA